jgi:hypothetical protein
VPGAGFEINLARKFERMISYSTATPPRSPLFEIISDCVRVGGDLLRGKPSMVAAEWRHQRLDRRFAA